MTGYVYAVVCGDEVKIGWSSNPKGRLVKIQADNPAPCSLAGVAAGTPQDEAELHSLFAPWQVRGEWYRYQGLIAAFVSMLRPYQPPGKPVATGHPLRVFRSRHRVTLQSLADAVGTTKATLSRIELGRQMPSAGLIAKLRDATGGAVSADDFLPQAEGRAA